MYNVRCSHDVFTRSKWGNCAIFARYSAHVGGVPERRGLAAQLRLGVLLTASVGTLGSSNVPSENECRFETRHHRRR